MFCYLSKLKFGQAVLWLSLPDRATKKKENCRSLDELFYFLGKGARIMVIIIRPISNIEKFKFFCFCVLFIMSIIIMYIVQ